MKRTPTTVQVWVVPLDAAPPEQAAALGPSEQARAQRYRLEDDRRRFVAARGWLRQVLGAELEVAPADVRLVEGPGKPRLEGGGLCFNLSHAGELALIALASFEVGVDIEESAAARPALDAARAACTPEELRLLRRIPEYERAARFLWWWTAKEAYLKATGSGLAVPPDSVDVGILEDRDVLAVRVGDGPALARSGWHARRLRPAPGYVGAVAAEGRSWQVRLRSALPAGLAEREHDVGGRGGPRVRR